MNTRLLLLVLIFPLLLGGRPQDAARDPIPETLDEALEFLEASWSDEDKKEFREQDENKGAANLHLGTGMSIRYSWGL